MKKMKVTRSFLAACSIVALTAVLSGCLHSGDDPPASGGDTSGALSLAAVPMHGLTDADAKEYKIEAGKSATVGNVTFTCPASSVDCTVTVTRGDDGTFTAAQTGGATVAYSAAYNKKIDDDKKAADAESNARALGLHAAMATPATATDFNPTVTATRGAGAAAVVKVADSVDDTEFKAATAPAAVSGWNGTQWMRGEATEYVTVYTNVDEPTASKFNAANVTTLTGRASPTITNGVLTLETGGQGEDGDHIVADDLPVPRAGTTSLTFSTAKEKKFSGTFGGASGTYQCTDTGDCSATVAHTGTVNLEIGTWTFTPDAGAKLQLPDTEYLYFGWWMDSPDEADADGEYPYKFRTFYGGPTSGFTAEQVTGLEGEATYSGKAAGVYVSRTFGEDRKATGGTSGVFGADVTLNAAFGGNDVAVNSQFRVSGEVTDFVEAGRSLGWAVTLEQAVIPDSGSGPAVFTGGVTNGYDGDGAPAGTPGTWTGMFFGSYVQGSTVPPSGVAGKFDANIGTTDLAGAFGASKE